MKKVMHEMRWPQTHFLALLALCTLGAFGAEDGGTATYRWNKTGYTDFSKSSAFTNATH